MSLLYPCCTHLWAYCTAVYVPYSFRTVVISKAALSSQLFKDPESWSGRGSNPWPPAQQTGTLPTELTRLRVYLQYTGTPFLSKWKAIWYHRKACLHWAKERHRDVSDISVTFKIGAAQHLTFSPVNKTPNQYSFRACLRGICVQNMGENCLCPLNW